MSPRKYWIILEVKATCLCGINPPKKPVLRKVWLKARNNTHLVPLYEDDMPPFFKIFSETFVAVERN
jgi:hypothetical protein